MVDPNLNFDEALARQARLQAAHQLKSIIRAAHSARLTIEGRDLPLSSLSPVPAMNIREDDPGLMLMAYALLVNDMLIEAEVRRS